MKEVKKLLYRNEKRYIWSGDDLHTDAGKITKEDLEKGKETVKSHTQKEFRIHDATFHDQLEKIKRGPQVMLEKDMGMIITTCGIGKDSIVLEAGTGSGKLTATLAHTAKKVITYEKEESNLNLAKKNVEFLKLKNVIFLKRDIYEGIKEKNLDAIILDLPEPFRVVSSAKKALKSGGFLVGFIPTIVQAESLVKKAEEEGFINVKTIELIEREWFIEGRKVRPKSQGLHTGFICFFRY